VSDWHTLDWRVSYADTDRMGVVYYANYLVLFERGRTEMLRDKGYPYKAMEDAGTYLPVVDAQIRYKAPARYDDRLTVRTRVSDLGRASITFDYQIVHAETGAVVVEGSTKHPFVNNQWKPVRTPDFIQSLFR